MSKEIYISSTPHETRLAIVENDALTEIYYERENEYTLAGSIYNGRVTRVLPGMQSSFVDVGLERDAFLYITDFMEEAPDSAEFDTSTSGDHAPRAPRVLEGAKTEEAAARPDSNGSEADRGERGGRARRGGRDKSPNRNPDRNQDRNRDRSASTASSSHTGSPSMGEPGHVNAPLITADELLPDPFIPASNDAEIGEGAPGADGSRRWRGRRGRRRGRGNPGQPGESAPESTYSGPAEGNSTVEDEVLFEGGSTYEIDGAAEVKAPVPTIPAVVAPRDPGRSQESQRGGRRDRQRDNARREGSRRDEPRADTLHADSENRPSQRTEQPQRVPRGFAPSRELYGVDSGEQSSTGPVSGAYETADPPTEPVILPGESLSKYRKGGEEPASSKPATDSTAVTLAPPSSLYTIAAGWDGGATLPGETLSRRQPSDPRPRTREDFPQRGEDRPPRRDGRSQRDARGAGSRDSRLKSRTPDLRNVAPPQELASTPSATVIVDLDGPSVAETPEEQPEVARAGHPEHFAPEEILHEVTETSQSATLHIQPQPLPEPVAADVPAAGIDYEPSEASASYRIDPLARIEYRQSASVLEQATEEAESSKTSLHDSPPETAHQSLAHTVTPAPDEPLARIHPDTELRPEPAELSIEAHDITSISAEGDMFSELNEPLTDAAEQPAPMEEPSPAYPIHHEGAVVALEHSFDPTPTQATDSGFSPGAGELAEEELDDEDFTAPTIHASSFEEMDYAEEETLEGAADLATMLREMSIDHLTRNPPPEIGDDDLEDDLEEDELDEDDQEEDDQENSEQNDGFATGEEDREGYNMPRSPQLDGSEDPLRTGTAADMEFFEAQFGQPSAVDRGETGAEQPSAVAAPRRDSGHDQERRGGRRDGRRDGRRGRSDRDRNAERPRSTGGSGDRERSGGNSRGRHSMQSTDLPAISDLLKPGQEILVQIAKEPIAKKGARITSHIALPGRFLVFMPTVHHTGVSRKIESDAERRRLKEILLSEKGEAAGGFIVRTAASGASEEELRSDLRFLLNLWSDIKARSESSKSPALIYHDLNLIERILRDQVTDSFSAIWVDSESEYERVLRFLQRFQPALIRRVKLYTKETPLFEQFGITEEINKALRSKVWLKSGGSIVINQTEALVAIDINTGKFVGKTARLEDTIVKTNLDAIPEIVRQIRLRDLGGIIIIDFIDMDERKNRNRVMAALEEELKADRAPSKVLQFNDFGLVAITRKRVKQSLERTLSTTCNVCVGTGMVKSPITVCNDIYVEMKKMHKHLDRGDVMLRVHPEVVKQLKTSGSKWLQEMEEMCGKTILVKSDPSLHPEQFDIH